MDLEGLVPRSLGSRGPLGAGSVPALLALDEALLILGLSSAPAAVGAADLRSAHRAALGVLQAQLQAGTLDRPGFRALAARLDLALRSALAATRASGAATSGPATSGPQDPPAAGLPPSVPPAAPGGRPAPASGPAAGSGPAAPSSVSTPPTSPPTSPTPTATTPPIPTSTDAALLPAPVSGAGVPGGQVAAAGTAGEPPAPTGVGPVPGGLAPDGPDGPAAPAAPAGPYDVPRPGAAGAPPEAGSAFADASQRSPRTDAVQTMIALRTMPLLNQTPPTRAQHDLWTAVLVPAAGRHVEAATALAATTGARTDPQAAAVVAHVALTLALADLPRDERRELLALAAGVYAQLEAGLPRMVLAGLPPRDLLGGLPIQLWASGPEVRFTALVVAFAVVAFAVWVGLR